MKLVYYTNVLDRIKPAEMPTARIVHDSPDEITRLEAALNKQPLNREKYCRLFVENRLMMTDAEFERATNTKVIQRAKGNVLIAGLGIGLILDPIIDKASSVTVIEKNADVIKIVAPAFPSVNVIHADIFDWRPKRNSRYDVIYFDIWPEIYRGDLKQALQLQKKFARYLKKGGYMASWCEIALKALGR